jgi:hypothetical protein
MATATATRPRQQPADPDLREGDTLIVIRAP